MKKSLLLLLCLLPLAALAQRGGQTVSLNLRQATASQVLDALKSSTSHEFFYRVNDVADVPQRDYHFTNAPLSAVMNQMTQGSGVQWSMRGNTVTISRREGAQQPPATGTISGKVTDENGKALQGASVMILGSNRGASTDANGLWSIGGVAGSTATIRVSFMGMNDAEQKVTVGRMANTQLKQKSIETDRVVVTGMIDRRDFSGAAMTLKAEDIARQGSVNLFQALRNLDPSLAMVDNMEFGSDPNRMPEIELRGTTGFPLSENDSSLRRMYQSNPNQPLFILNGFETTITRVFDLDMQRIESVTILKDAAAKAIYGAKAANGVVVIETKRRAGGELVITYRGSADITMPDLTSYDLTNSVEKLQVEKLSGLYANDQLSVQTSNDQIYQQRLNAALAGVNTDWLSKPLRTGVGTKHSIGVELSDGGLSFLGDMSYNDIAGVMKKSGRTTLSGNVEVQYRKTGKFMFRNAISIANNKSTDSPYGTFREYADMNPYFAPYDAAGNLIKSFEGVNNYTQNNPLYNAQLGTSLTANYLNFNNNFYAEYYPIEGMMARIRMGVETQRDEKNKFYPGDHTLFAWYTSPEDELRRGSYEHGIGRKDNISGDVMMQYNKNLGERHMIMSNLIYSMSQTKSHEVNYKAEGFPSEKMNDIMFARMYEKDGKPTGWESIVRDMAFTGVLSYSYDNRYLMDATLRGSASSQYSPKKRWGAFWSFGAAWNIHNEKFAAGQRWLDQFKLRASVGSTGNQNIESNAHMVTYKYYTDQFYAGQRPYVGSGSTQIGAYIMRLANPDLRWEQELQGNVGFDARFFNRLSITADVYLSNTTDKVVDFTVPSTTGYNMIKENVGNIENKGYEARVTYRLVDRPDFFLNITGSVAGNKNKIKSLSDAMRHYNALQDKIVDNRDGGGRWRPVLKYVEGGSMTALWAVPSLGINPANGREIYVRPDGSTTYTYSSAYQQIVGDLREKVRGLFGFDGEWKGFGFNLTFRFIAGGDYYNQTLIQRVENADIRNNLDRRVFLGRWTEDNRGAAFKRLEPYTDSQGNRVNVPYTQPTSRFVQKRNELDIAAVSVYYDFARFRAIKNIGMERLRVAVNMNDIHKFSTIKVERGTDYPFARTMSISLTAEF